MKKYFLIFLLSASMATKLFADEGMWIPMLLEQLNIKDMKSMGLKLNADDIYSINHSSLKDAIVLFGSGCTAEIISEKGLIATNHHCGFGNIQYHSNVSSNYLKNGFWAKNFKEELPNPGLTVTFLVRMEDVTKHVLQNVTPTMTESERSRIIEKNASQVIQDAIKGTTYDGIIKAHYYGNAFYLFITETYKDVRLVGAPPSSIGKFGGDTDNWVWPRHTGDFSLFRIYANKNNEPADYSPDNVPYKPKKSLSISLKGVNENDFTFVLGYPGYTQEYTTSHGVKMTTQILNPAVISLRDKRLEIYNNFMKDSDSNKLRYASKYANIANYWKKLIGENRGIDRYGTIKIKQEQEALFVSWTNQNAERKKKYGSLLNQFEVTYNELEPSLLLENYYQEAVKSIELLNYASNYKELILISQNKPHNKLSQNLEQLQKISTNRFKNYNIIIDKKQFIVLLQQFYDALDIKLKKQLFNTAYVRFNGDFQKYADYVYSQSFMADFKKSMKFLESYTANKYKKIEKDPAFELCSNLNNYFNAPSFTRNADVLQQRLDSLYRIYLQGLMEMSPNKKFYPDANLSMRVTYGKVSGYFPQNAIQYNYFTTLSGIIEKEDSLIYDYKVDEKLKTLSRNKDYGKYVDKDGTMHVCFIATNHTSGGNSGSPVLNGEGHLIGINFDRNWEGTMSDIMYNPDLCRNIVLDARYMLFIIDKYAGAHHLIDEMNLIN